MPPEHHNSYLVLCYTQTNALASMEQHLYNGGKKRNLA